MRYYKLNTISTISKSLLEYAESSNQWKNKNSFDLVTVPYHLIKSDITLNYFYRIIKSYPVILKMEPNSFYRFHIDEKRKCAINMLLDGFDSNCYFADPTDSEDVFNNVEELLYKPNTYYLLNTTQKHAVMNRSKIRYMFSMGVNDFTYEFVLNVCKTSNYFIQK
jgi:hypothetical protein